MEDQESRIQSCIDHIKTALDVDDWAKELAVEALEKELKNLTQEVKNSSVPDTNVGNNDCISRADVEQTVEDNISCYTHSDRPIDQDPDTECHMAIRTALRMLRKDLRKLPSVQPESKPISYTDCANAMLMMWMDHVLTDGEYNRIMDKLNAHEMKKREENG